MPWLGQPCRLVGPFLEARDLDAMPLRAAPQVADLEAQQVVDVHEAERLPAVDGERADARGERADLADDLVRARARHGQVRRVQPREVGLVPLQADDRVVRGRVGRDLGDDLAVLGPHHVPEGAFERRQVDQRAVRRDRHPVAATLVFPLPEQLLGHQVQAHELLDRADVDASRPGTGTDALHVVRHSLGVEPGGGDPLDQADGRGRCRRPAGRARRTRGSCGFPAPRHRAGVRARPVRLRRRGSAREWRTRSAPRSGGPRAAEVFESGSCAFLESSLGHATRRAWISRQKHSRRQVSEKAAGSCWNGCHRSGPMKAASR